MVERYTQPKSGARVARSESSVRPSGARYTNVERRYLPELMERNEGKAVAVAQQAGIGRAHLYRLLRKHRLLGQGR